MFQFVVNVQTVTWSTAEPLKRYIKTQAATPVLTLRHIQNIIIITETTLNFKRSPRTAVL